MKLKYDRERILQAVDKIVKKTMQMDMTWDWPCGVAYYGVAAAYERTGREEYLTLLKNRVDELISLGLPQVWTVNTCAMGHCLITLYQATGEERYWDLVMSKMKYLRTQALRFGDRVLQHTVSPKNDFPEQAWADTLFMAAYLMLRVGVISRDEELVNDALNQWYWHINYLQDPEKGFYYHGYNNISGDHMSGIYWGRANAWAAYTMSRVGWTLPECYLYPQYMDVSGSLSEQLSALRPCRRKTDFGEPCWMMRKPTRKSPLPQELPQPWCATIIRSISATSTRLLKVFWRMWGVTARC